MKRRTLVFLSCAGAVGLALVVSAVSAGRQTQDKDQLPPAVARAVEENRPDAEIDKLEVDKKDGITLYDIEFKGDQGEIEVTEDGTVLDVVSIVQMEDIPWAAAEAIRKAAAGAGAEILRLEKSEVRAEIKSEDGKGRIVKLDSPRYVFEAELKKGNQTGEVEVAEDGSIIEMKWDG